MRKLRKIAGVLSIMAIFSTTLTVNATEGKELLDDYSEVNIKLGTAACPFNYSTAADKYGYTISGFKNETVSDNYAKSFIIGAITADRPVLVGMHTDTGSGTHFVAAYGYSGNTIYIHDPASNRNYTTLDTYLSSYYVNRLVIFN